MATPFQIREVTKAADTMLANDRRSGRTKLEWHKLPIDSLPADLAALAHEACVAECMARRAIAAFKTAMDDKVIPPAGKRFIFAVERGVSDPDMIGDMLFAEAQATSGGTQTTTFNQLIAKYK